MKKWYSKVKLVALAAAVILMLPMVASAQTDPKGTFYAPPGTDILLLYYKHITSGESYTNGVRDAQKQDFAMDLAMMRYAHYGKVGNFPWAVNAIVPYGTSHLTKGTFDERSSGFGDPVLVLVGWFLDGSKFNLTGEVSGYLTVPLGEYRNDRTINFGNNRWAFKVEPSIAWKPFNPLTWEVAASIEAYTDNNDANINGATLKKDPYYGAWTHLTYDINKTFFVSGSCFWFKGSETTLDGVSKNNEAKTLSGMLTTGINISPNITLLFQFKHDIDVEYGSKTDTIGTRLSYFF